MDNATATSTASSTSDDQYIKSRREHRRYINSFNPEFRLPGVAKVFRYMFTTPKNTNLPATNEELDRTLPIIRHTPEEILKTTSGLRFIWIGHATCFIQMDDFTFLTDPVFHTHCGATPSTGPKRYRPAALTVDALPDNLEAVVISHNHYDHLDQPSVQSLNERYGNKLTWFCGQGGGEWFRDCNIQNIIELDWWEEWEHPVEELINLINFSIISILFPLEKQKYRNRILSSTALV